MQGYWQRRLTRRRVLAGSAGGTGLLALTILGCGGDDSGGSGEKVTSRVTAPRNLTAEAKRGGIFQGMVATDETTLDPLASSRGGGAGGPALPAYGRMLQEKPSIGTPVQKIEGDIAESWELSADNLSLTMKIRADAKFDPRPPTNGRNVTAEDVVFSLNKFFAQSPYASQLSYKVDPTSPVESVEAIDARTVKYKLAFPWSPLLATMALGNHLIMPKEADGGFDPKREIRGSSKWMLTEYQPSSVFKWRKNPNYWNKEYPFLEGYDTPIIPEYATRVSQFRAKAIWDANATFNLNAGDVIDMANSLPDAVLYAGITSPSITSIAFGSKPGSPWFDQRMRQAVSLSLDREAWALADSGGDLYGAAGIPFPLTISSNISSFWGDYWIDPTSSKMGEGAKFYKHDPAEAKKLVSAAGFPNGLDVPAQVASSTHASPQVAEQLGNMMRDAGIKLSINVVDYNSVFLPKIWVPGAVKGDYDGLTFGNSGGSQGHIMSYLYIDWHTKGSFTAARRWDAGQDKIDQMIEKGLKEFDAQKQKQIVWDIQKELATYMSGVTYTYGRAPFTMAWPWVQNYNVYQTTAGSSYGPQGGAGYDFIWYDESKKG
ncbi:MAG: ABC transporter substrate-binding protein [Dehalococcoidia bacterium]